MFSYAGTMADKTIVICTRGSALALAQGRPDPADFVAERSSRAAAAEEKTRAERQRARSATRASKARAGSRASLGHYTVAAGDSLWTIAGKLGTTVEDLKRANGLIGRHARPLKVGERLATGG